MDNVTLRWLDVDKILGESLVAEAFGKGILLSAKDRALIKLGIFSLKLTTASCEPVRRILKESGAVAYFSIVIVDPKNFDPENEGLFSTTSVRLIPCGPAITYMVPTI